MSAPAPLERFALKAHPEGLLGGLGMAIHAIPDAFSILHGGVGCKYKQGSELHAHDRARPTQITSYTEVTDADLSGGSARRIGPYLRAWYERRRPSFMVVATVTFLEMTGEDFAAEVRGLANSVPCATAYIPCLGFEGDLYQGYGAVTIEVLRKVPFRGADPDSKTVSLLGYLFDRYEMDHEANLREIRRLLASLGLRTGPILLSGRPFPELRRASESGILLGLPYLGKRRDEAQAIAGRPIHALDLPVGITGTFRWLHRVAEAAGVSPGLAARFERAEAGPAARQLDIFRSHVLHRFPEGRCAVFADTPLAAGLATLLVEAGLPPALVGLSDRSLGGREGFLETVGRIGVRLPEEVEILESPSLQAVRAGLSRLRTQGRLAAVLGSTIELNCLPPEEGGDASRIARVEIGFPSVNHHALTPSPFYGIPGALGILQRIMNRLGEAR